MKNNIFFEIKKKWDDSKIPSHYNHTDIDDKRNDDYKKYVVKLSNYDFSDKVVVDYGCGGGWLGKYLLENFNIKKYIAIDISANSLKAAKENLKDFDNVKFIKIKNWLDLKELKADIFISLACIQHFPSVEFLKGFLKMVNESDCNNLILQYRVNQKNLFNLISKNVFTWALILTRNSIDKFLTNYTRWGGITVIKKTYRYSYFKRKIQLKREIINSAIKEVLNDNSKIAEVETGAN